MNKKYKRVFSINLQPGYRNYTIKDLQDIKGKKKLTQILVSDALEASAAEEAGIDLILAKPDENVPLIRKAAPKTFMTVSVPFIKYSSKEEIVKKSLELVEHGADSIHCGSWNLNFMKYLNQFRKLDCIKKTTFDDHIKRHYFFSHENINPTRIIPIGPIVF